MEWPLVFMKNVDLHPLLEKATVWFQK